VSAVLPMLVLLETDLLKGDVKDMELTNDIKYRALDVIKRRYNRLDDIAIVILGVAMYLNPHFKVHYFEQLQEDELPSINQKVTDDALEVRKELQEIQQVHNHSLLIHQPQS